jgi:hypothetical protein
MEATKLNAQNTEKIPAVRKNNIRFEVFVNPVQLAGDLTAIKGLFDVVVSEDLLSALAAPGDGPGESWVAIAQP